MIWYTADLHLNLAAIIGHCGRPFASASHMDDALIAALVARLAPEDDLYVVGNFAFGGASSVGYVRRRFEQIPGRKHLMVGNHDRPWVRELPWAGVHDVVEVKDGTDRVVLCHYPTIT